MGFGGGVLVDAMADHGVSLGGYPVDVIEPDLAAQPLGHREVRHEHPGPLLGAAADVGDLDALFHGKHLFVSLLSISLWC